MSAQGRILEEVKALVSDLLDGNDADRLAAVNGRLDSIESRLSALEAKAGGDAAPDTAKTAAARASKPRGTAAKAGTATGSGEAGGK